jgi:diguanylate cyclase (GGDEF)-like protein
MSVIELREPKYGEAVRARRAQGNQLSAPRLKRHEQRRLPGGAALEESLSSALLALDKELGQIVREVEEISNTLKTGVPDARSLRIAQHPAVWGAVKHALLERELRHLDLTDALTCLYNRRGFFAAATQLLNLARRKAQAVLLLLCDVDNLNLIRNSLGQREGDSTLIRAADALEQTFRHADVIARIGEHEFAVLLPEASSQAQGILLDRLEKGIRKLGARNGRASLSLSVGVSCFDPKRAVSLGELMSQAKQAMNEKKRKQPVERQREPQSGARTICETNMEVVTRS